MLLRFDGVESMFRVWLNGTEVGVGKGSRLATEFDVTELLVAGDNVLAVRVHQWSSASYLEDQDQWWLPGIFREVTLVGRPYGGIDDVWLRAGYADGSGTGPARSAAGRGLPGDHQDPRAGGEPDRLGGPLVRCSRSGPSSRGLRSTAALRRGGRRGGGGDHLPAGLPHGRDPGRPFLVNGGQLAFRGMNRHETHPERGRMFDEEHARADLIRMKQHNVNAIRTSHYPPHPRCSTWPTSWASG